MANLQRKFNVSTYAAAHILSNGLMWYLYLIISFSLFVDNLRYQYKVSLVIYTQHSMWAYLYLVTLLSSLFDGTFITDIIW